MEDKLELKNQQCSKLQAKCDSLEIALAEKERKIIDLEQKIIQTQGHYIRDEQNTADANMAIKERL